MNPYIDLDRLMLGDIYTSNEAMDNLMVLCDDFGARAAGTPDERAAAEFLAQCLTKYGFNQAELQPYEYAAWECSNASLEVISPFASNVDGIALPYCPACNFEAPLLMLEDGSPDSFQKREKDIPGAIVAVSSAPPPSLGRSVHRTEMYHRAALAGAVGFIFIGMYEGRGPETGSIDHDQEALIPGVSIDHESAEYLRRQTTRKGPLTLRVRVEARTFQTTSWNVVAELPGESDELVLFGSHYDGHLIAQGASDPASGVVAALEAARVLARHARPKLTRTLRAIFWGTEEIGLIGAYRDVETHAADLDRIRFLLNCDAAGGHGEKGVVLNQLPELEPLFDRFGEELGDLAYRQSTHAFSDHFPYFLQGVPTAYVGNPRGKFSGRGWGHTRYDTVDKVELRDVRNAAALVARVVLRTAAEAEWPVARRAPEAVQPFIESETELCEMRAVEEAYRSLYAARRPGSQSYRSPLPPGCLG